MTNLIEENKLMQEKYKSMFEKMQQELRRKQLYIEELKNRVFINLRLKYLNPYKTIKTIYWQTFTGAR